MAEREALKDRIEAHLKKTEVLTLKEDAPPVGLCSLPRARWLGMAASVAGGAIYVNVRLPGHDEGLLSVGTLPSGEPVPDRVLKPIPILESLRKEITRLSNNTCLPSIWEDVQDLMNVHSKLVAFLRAS